MDKDWDEMLSVLSGFYLFIFYQNESNMEKIHCSNGYLYLCAQFVFHLSVNAWMKKVTTLLLPY